MNLQEFYQSAGGNASATTARLGCNEKIILKFLKMFLADESFEGLTESLSKGDIQTAFRKAHTLKGIVANLGLENLYVLASDVTEILRPSDGDICGKMGTVAAGENQGSGGLRNADAQEEISNGQKITKAKTAMPRLSKEYCKTMQNIKNLPEN